MAFVDITSAQHAAWGTHTHGDEGFATPGGDYPAQLRWSDLHPPGVKILPKGSPPAGEGEINWEDTLGGKFALALEQLEGLLYAVYGSRPAAYPDGSGGWDKAQWYDRIHPRCLWGPEMWQRRLLNFNGSFGCGPEGQCWDYEEGGKEYAALGESPPCCPMPFPSAPIRTRSGDPAGQFATGVHDRAFFPLGSVTRDFAGDPFDPEGYGWFGATQPGRDDSPPWLDEANGYNYVDGDVVTFSWTEPAGIEPPGFVKLWYRTQHGGGGWSGWSSINMTPAGDTWSASLGPLQHGTECQWYIQIVKLGVPGIDPGYTRYDPGGDTAPINDDAYYLQWFTHFNPYRYGLPEMLEDLDGVDIRHGTDHYRFDGSETVQPELINMVRWVLSWLGGDCCTGEYDTCAETDDRSDVLHHNPRFRGGGHGLCCVPMPIRFRWSGSNRHPHYMTGGKAGGLDSRPLHNRDADLGDPAARRTWRGINMLFADDTHFDNPFYGGGYSWGTAPGTFVLMHKPNWDPEAKVWAEYPSWGLQPGDVIEAVHVQEIIDAVGYLIDYGAWTTAPICTRSRTPGQFMGKDCGYHRMEQYEDCYGASGEEWRIGCDKCCANGSVCSSDDYALGYWFHEWGPGYDDSFTGVEDTCEPWDPPTWQECTDTCLSAKCHMMTRKSGHSQYSPDFDPSCPCGRAYFEDTVCAGYDPDEYFSSIEGAIGCGYHRDEAGCKYFDSVLPGPACLPSNHSGYHCIRRVEGFSYYACTPPACSDGWDNDHGGLFKKNRLDHLWCHDTGQGVDCSGLWSKATGPPGSEFSGNCLGDIFGCGETYPLGPDAGLWFQEVAGVHWEGMVSDWYTGCDGMPACDPGCGFGDVIALPPAIPGFGHHDIDDDPLCQQWQDVPTGCFSAWADFACCDGHVCQCAYWDFGACKGEAAWVAVDLNLDGSGRPYRNFPGRNGDVPPYDGRGVPWLRDYDLTKDPAVWMHDCPCETWTGESQCVI